MDFQLTPEQRALQSQVVAFARRELGAHANEHDRDGTFDREGWQACARFGVLGWPIATAHGGSGFDPLTSIIAFEALAYGCVDNGLVFAINNHVWACAISVATHGTTEQRDRFLPGLIDGSLVGAHALTEPDAGSDVLSVQTTAERRGDHYVLNGTKTFISNGACADLFVVFACTDPDAAPQARLSAFVVPTTTPGVTVVRAIDKAGLRASPMGEICFADAVIPTTQVLRSPGAGYQIFSSAMEFERGFMFAAHVGALQRILDHSVEYAAKRRQFGRPIGGFQAVSHKIADMRVSLELARLLLYKVGWLKREGRVAMLEAAMLKLFASESLVSAALDAMQVHGARGYVSDLPIERDVRDALGSTIYGGTSEVQRNIIAGLIGLPA